MFFPKCPVCGGKCKSVEPSHRYAKHGIDQWLKTQAAANHPHPYLKIGVTALVGLSEVYKRLPGGGRKQCTSCGHEFS